MVIPNIPSDKTPIGKDEDENVVMQEYLNENKKTNVVAHYEIAVKKDIVDFKRAVKMSGARFWLYKGLGAKLVRALQSYMLDKNSDNGYLEMLPPSFSKFNLYARYWSIS